MVVCSVYGSLPGTEFSIISNCFDLYRFHGPIINIFFFKKKKEKKINYTPTECNCFIGAD